MQKGIERLMVKIVHVLSSVQIQSESIGYFGFEDALNNYLRIIIERDSKIFHDFVYNLEACRNFNF